MDTIGKVQLDYSVYPGEDFYSDGQVEEELLRVARDLSPVEYEQVIGGSRSWPILYHLSPLRENIVEWIPMNPESKVLEVGSGCGAITGVLARKAGSVSCVELSKRRSLINAYRHSDCDNITIHVGNFKDVEPQLATDYDYIFLIGVLEYAESYIGGQTPYEDFLKILMPHLKKGGRLVIAIENQYGLKYFAGCNEDHLSSYFAGIENYPESKGVRTFGKKGLERVLERAGIENYHFYYPYPDYKFMHSLYSDSYLPRRGELADNLRNFDNDRMVLFDEKNAFDGLLGEGLFPAFSNSFLVVAGDGFDTQFVKYSNDRAAEYAIKTEIVRPQGGDVVVRKYPMTAQAQAHVKNMAASCEKLTERFAGGKLLINRCRLLESEEVCAEFEYVDGISLSELMNRCLDAGDMERFMEYFREFVERIDYNNSGPVAERDLIFSNILVQGEQWTLIDYEWTFDRAIETKELAFRAMYYLAREDEKRERIEFDRILDELAVTPAEAEEYWEQEKVFQRSVAGRHITLSQMRDLIGNALMEPDKWIDWVRDQKHANRVQVYEDTGAGYDESKSYFPLDAYRGDHEIELTLEVSGDVRMLRIDPAFDSCVVRIEEMTFNGRRVPLETRRMLVPNGRILKTVDKKDAAYQPSIVFPTEDPNLNIDLTKLERQAENILYVKMKVQRLLPEIARDMYDGAKKLI